MSVTGSDNISAAVAAVVVDADNDVAGSMFIVIAVVVDASDAAACVNTMSVLFVLPLLFINCVVATVLDIVYLTNHLYVGILIYKARLLSPLWPSSPPPLSQPSSTLLLCSHSSPRSRHLPAC